MKFARSTSQTFTASSLLQTTLFLLFILIYTNLPSAWQIPCLFYNRTGLPCPTCGTTRCVQLILQGNLHDAGLQQPLMFFALIIFGLLIFYRIACRLLRQPALHIQLETRRERVVLGIFIALLITANWGYLMGSL